MKLSACVIMRDAEKDLPDCLGSIVGADELVIADTGSKDGSVSVAREYTDKVYSFPWQGDFSAARNYCMDKAAGDWIFFLDSDEYVTEETRGNLRRIVESLDVQGYDALDIRRENVGEDHGLLPREGDFALRLFRKDENARYHSPIHEYLEYNGKREWKKGMVSPQDFCIHHKGYSPSRIHGKYLRNVQMLEDMEARGQKHRFSDYYLAGLHFSEKEYEKALIHAQRAVETKALPSFDSFGSWRIWHNCLKALGRSEEEQEHVLKLGMEAYPSMPDFFLHYGVLLLNRGKLADALGYLRKGEDLLNAFSVNCPRELNPMESARGQIYHALEAACLGLGKEPLARHYADMEWKIVLGITDMPPRGFSEYIPPKSRSVIEFGCGTGETGRAFCRIQPECCYVGVDVDEAALREAGKHLSRVALESPRTMDFARHGIELADCILYQDRVLHELTGDSLRRHRKQLRADGQMIFVLENLGYFRHVLHAFAAKDVPFRSGLTMGRLQGILKEAGLKVFSVQPVYLKEDEQARNHPETKSFVQACEACCKGAGVAPSGDPWARRYIVRAVQEPVGKGFFLQAMLGEVVATARIRVDEPHAFLQTVPGIVCHSTAQSVDLGQGRQFARKVLLRQRITFQEVGAALSQIETIRKAGYLLSYELDDSPVRWQESHEKSKYLDFVGSHVVQVSTPALAEVIRRYNPHVAVFPNELRELPERRVYDEAAPVTVFFGALNREQEWGDIMPVLNEAAAKYGAGLRFRVLADRPFFDALKTEHKEFIGSAAYFGGKFVPYEVYTHVLHSADISLLPLKDTAFNRAKSDLKFIESAGHGAVVLASPTVYAATVRDGRTGFLYRNPREFRQRLTMLVEDRARRMEMAEAAYSYVRRERLLCQHYEERRAFYDEMLDRKAELDRELDERLRNLDKIGV